MTSRLAAEWGLEDLGPGDFASCPFSRVDGSWRPWQLLEASPAEAAGRLGSLLWSCLLCDRCPQAFSGFVVALRRAAWAEGHGPDLPEQGLAGVLALLADRQGGLRPRAVLPEVRAWPDGATLVLAGPLLPLVRWPDARVAEGARGAVASALSALEAAGLEPAFLEREPSWDLSAAWAGDIARHAERISRVAEAVAAARRVVCLSHLEALALRQALGASGPAVESLYEAVGWDTSARHAEPAIASVLFDGKPSPENPSFLRAEPEGHFEGMSCGVRGWLGTDQRCLRLQDELLGAARAAGTLVSWDPETYLHLAGRTGPGVWVTHAVQVSFGPTVRQEGT